MTNNHYDIIMAGGGAATRILLYFMSRQPRFRQQRILVLERENRIAEKTWCFWSKQQHPFEHLISHQWTSLEFRADEFSTVSSIDPYRYCCIRGADFDRYFNLEFFPDHSNITISNQHITATVQHGNQWLVTADENTYSCNQLISNTGAAPAEGLMYQHFHGWLIEYSAPCFDPGKALLMDFKVPANNQFCFFYVLPFSETKALVECTYYSSTPFKTEVYRQEIQRYLATHYGSQFDILQTEQGAIPLQSKQQSAATTPHFIPLGQSAGMIKASTGYAFQRMVEDARILAATMHLDTCKRRQRHQRFRFYDRLLLSIIREEPRRAVAIFQQLFRKNRMASILTFLDENSTLLDEIKIFAQLPWWPFLKRIKQSS